MILRMLTSTSLAAFSVVPGGAAPAGPTVARPIQPARTGGPGGTSAPERPKPPVSAAPSPGGADPSAGRPLPRGSLLDLAV